MTFPLEIASIFSIALTNLVRAIESRDSGKCYKTNQVLHREGEFRLN